MSLYDDITPSERAAELSLVVKRLRRHTNLAVIPMLVVEGSSDEIALAELCSRGQEQIFPGGTRDLVEQLLRHLQKEPIDGCDCVFLVDCDGRGKTVSLASVSELLVTQCCDMEADLATIGVATRLTRRFVPTDEFADELVSQACGLGMAVSVVRRAANAVSVSMKKGDWQLRLTDLPEIHLSAWEVTVPAETDVLGVVAVELAWTPEQIEAVANEIPAVRRDFPATCMGKDALDSLYRLLLNCGEGDVRGWGRDFFYRSIFASLEPTDAENWEVGRRLIAWEDETGHRLLERPR